MHIERTYLKLSVTAKQKCIQNYCDKSNRRVWEV